MKRFPTYEQWFRKMVTRNLSIATTIACITIILASIEFQSFSPTWAFISVVFVDLMVYLLTTTINDMYTYNHFKKQFERDNELNK